MKHKKALILLLIVFLIGTMGCGTPKSESFSRTGFFFDTVISITIYHSDSQLAKTALFDCFELCKHYESLFSRTMENSDIWKINNAAGETVAVNRETYSLLQTALYYSELTDGQIDATIAPVAEAWNFSQNNEENASHIIPDHETLKELLKHVDYHNIILSEKDGKYYVSLSDAKSAVDLGFLAKGYIADRIKELLQEEGITSAVIDLGGNICTLGCKPDNTSFRIGIRKPFAESKTPMTVLDITDLSVVSSGNYERYFQYNGQIYHHILNTQTGYPIQNNLLQVTIISASSMEGDALSTTCYVLGLEKGMKLIESLTGVEAIFVTEDYQLHYTSGMTQ